MNWIELDGRKRGNAPELGEKQLVTFRAWRRAGNREIMSQQQDDNRGTSRTHTTGTGGLPPDLQVALRLKAIEMAGRARCLKVKAVDRFPLFGQAIVVRVNREGALI